MNEPAWKTCRILANKTRLRILRWLLVKSELCEFEIALFLDLTRPSASRHIRLLSESGFIKTIPRSKWIVCSLRDPKPKEPLHDVQKVLIKNLTSGEKQIDKIYRSATAFTHERRCCIIRLLQNKSMSLEELVDTANISAVALLRHLKKLINRGLIAERNDAYHFISQSDPLTNSLINIVLHS